MQVLLYHKQSNGGWVEDDGVCHFPSLCGGFLSAGYVTLIALLGFAFSM